jgi:hypothetical protein
MSMIIQEIYTQVMRTLSPKERLYLAAHILNDLTLPDSDVIDESDTWTDQDQFDLAAFSLQSAAAEYPESDELAK